MRKDIPYCLFKTLFALPIPITCFLSFWWGSFLLTKDENTIKIAALSGLFAGLAAGAYELKACKTNVYELPRWIRALSYLYYNICVLGFFMGVPLFNTFLGPLAGWYSSKRLLHINPSQDQIDRELRSVPEFTSIVMTVVCVLSAVVALADKYTAGFINKILGLSFELTRPMLLIPIVAGGILLVAFQYWLTKRTMEIVLKK